MMEESALPVDSPRHTHQGWALLVLVLALVGLSANGILSYHHTRQLSIHERRVAHSHQVLHALEESLSTLKDAETGQRGFLLTGEDRYLLPYDEALVRLHGMVRRLRALTADNPGQQRRIIAFEQTVNERLEMLRQGILVRRQQGSEAARLFIVTGLGKREMDNARRMVAEMEQDERGLLQARQVEALGSYNTALISALIATIAGVCTILVAYLLFLRDQRARRRAAEALHRQREWLRTTLSSIGDAVLVTDAQGRVRFLNPVARAFTGWQDDALGRPIAEVFRIRDEETGEPVKSPVDRVLREGRTVGLDRPTILLSRDGKATPIDDSGAPIRDTSGALVGVVMVFRDVSTKKREAEELRRAKEAAEEASRIKSLFLANMSHELRTPLNAVIGYSEILQEEADEIGLERLVPDLQKIHGAGKHLLALINDILDLSKIEAGKVDVFLETVDVATVLTEVADTVRPLIEKNHNTLTMHLQEPLGTMRTDLTKLRQSLFNLLSNAGKFTQGGAITLSAERHQQDGADRLRFAVTDTGIGMTPGQERRLFSAFTQGDPSTTRRFGGTGLGLAISKRFCEMLGGDITVRSEKGRGSTFTIDLPAEAPAPPHAALTPTPEPLAGGSGDRPVAAVVVIDDDPVARELIGRALARDGFHVRTAATGKEGMSLARALRPAVITLDVLMPGEDGWAVLSALKADPELRSIPVVMLTIQDNRGLGYALGAADCLTKPVDREHLSLVLRRYACLSPPCPVLLVEDDLATRQMMRAMLEREGWAVTEADNGQAALCRIAEQRPDLILLDLMMPEMDGFTFATELRRHPEWRAIPILVLTAKDLTQEERLRLNGHVERILQKGGLARDELLREIRELARRCADT